MGISKLKKQLLYNTIDEILWNDWDPIGINENEESRDEYYSYIPKIMEFSINTRDQKKIFNQLNNIVSVSMGITSINKENNDLISTKIIKLTNDILGEK